jgi:hypothetical protein
VPNLPPSPPFPLAILEDRINPDVPRMTERSPTIAVPSTTETPEIGIKPDVPPSDNRIYPDNRIDPDFQINTDDRSDETLTIHIRYIG